MSARREDPIPTGGLTEQVACKLHAMDGVWPEWFLRCLAVAYGSREVPRRFVDRAASDLRALEWDRRMLDALERAEGACT